MLRRHGETKMIEPIEALKLVYPDREAIRLPAHYGAHFWMRHDSLPPVIVWYAQRSTPFGEYDAYAMPMDKYMVSRNVAESMQGFFDVVVQWGDGKVTVSQRREKRDHPTPFAIHPGGKEGNEPMVYLGVGGFKEIEQNA